MYLESWIHFHVSPQYGGFRAHLCLEADYILEKMEPVTLDEGETDVAWWNRGWCSQVEGTPTMSCRRCCGQSQSRGQAVDA